MAVAQHAVSQQTFCLRVARGLHLPSDLRDSVQHVQFGSRSCKEIKNDYFYCLSFASYYKTQSGSIFETEHLLCSPYLGLVGGILLFWTRGQTLTCWLPQFSEGRQTRTLKLKRIKLLRNKKLLNLVTKLWRRCILRTSLVFNDSYIRYTPQEDLTIQS